jgi:polyisoprenoid-binding protein YceI
VTSGQPEPVTEPETVSGRELTGGGFQLAISGPLEIRDRAVRVTLDVRVDLKGDTLVATGKAALRQSAFGITPVSVAGVVKVKDDLSVDFRFEARPRP